MTRDEQAREVIEKLLLVGYDTASWKRHIAAALTTAHRDGMLRAAEIADSAAEVAQTLADRCRDGSLDHTLHSFVARNYRDIAGQIRATAIEAAANEATIDTAPAEKEHERWDYRKYSKEKIRK